MPKRTDIRSPAMRKSLDSSTPSPLVGEGWGGGQSALRSWEAKTGLPQWPRRLPDVCDETKPKRNNAFGLGCAVDSSTAISSAAKCRWALLSLISLVSRKSSLLKSTADSMQSGQTKTIVEAAGLCPKDTTFCGSGITTYLATRMACWRKFATLSTIAISVSPPLPNPPPRWGEGIRLCTFGNGLAYA